ncbi:hypothetical protein BU23DRAFT_595538 [Bimuria novae-zelandiae CBS 107.79]|uniref:Uncharacterized protein n=1 Tax=Bimuria novae-zelandiae CBS 107.79 TaxID=1447943 RepID=A0A6A5VNZ3_9PLEO|nr:hypothetical protein BU23DRAFT_595538 [Bimuria novae-zelandiae CBS 107.79]
MQLAATTLLALIGAASALPSNILQARDGITITFYPEANFAGEPVSIPNVPNAECQQVPEGVTVGSVQVESGALCRLTYSATTCTTHGDVFVFPDTPADDLTNETVTSYLCQTCTGC